MKEHSPRPVRVYPVDVEPSKGNYRWVSCPTNQNGLGLSLDRRSECWLVVLDRIATALGTRHRGPDEEIARELFGQSLGKSTDRRLEAETPDALKLQKPLPDDALRIVAEGEKEDGR